jgi:thermolabile hemolysin
MAIDALLYCVMPSYCRPTLRLAAALIAGACHVASSAAGPFTDLIVFGDSLSDMGNVAQASFDLFPGPYYSNDRFSNGPVWVESLAVDLGLGALQRSTAGGDNFAYGGAKTTGTGGFEGLFIRDIDEQVTQFLNARTVDPAALFVVFAGSNDLIQGQTNMSVPVNRLTTDLNRLIAAGAREFLVPNLPLLGFTPRFNDSAALAEQYNARTQQFNTALGASLDALASGNLDLTFHRLDVSALFAEAIATPHLFGLTNVVDSAAPGLEPGAGSYDAGQIATNAHEYLFWDDLHPTATVHAILADRAVALLDGVPGDFDADGHVDADDLATWTANFGAAGATRKQGDADGDRIVDGADFLAWQRNLSVGSLVATVPVPESASGVMFTTAVVSLVIGHSRGARSGLGNWRRLSYMP